MWHSSRFVSRFFEVFGNFSANAEVAFFNDSTTALTVVQLLMIERAAFHRPTARSSEVCFANIDQSAHG